MSEYASCDNNFNILDKTIYLTGRMVLSECDIWQKSKNTVSSG